MPYEALTPEKVIQALAEYIDFSPVAGTRAAIGATAPDQLRKGLTVDEVDRMLGRPESIAQRMEGTLSVSSSSYRSRGRIVVADFVEGVLVRFAIRSE